MIGIVLAVIALWHQFGNDDTPPDPEAITRQMIEGDELAPTAPPTTAPVARNAPCPCGSGNKYKRCHGASPS